MDGRYVHVRIVTITLAGNIQQQLKIYSLNIFGD
jgi:hypothetical protein